EAPLQKFGHSENVAAQVEGHKNPAENQQDQAGQPFEMAYCQTGRCASARQTDKVFGGDIGYEQRRADEEPTNVAAGKEIIFGSALLAREVHADAKHDGEIDPDDDEVYRCQV